jgi:hypothetical protein
MKAIAKTRKGSRHSAEVARANLALWARLTCLALAMALMAGVALGAPLHSSERGCNMPTEPGCEHMLPGSPGVASTQLCCLLDCQEPGSTGSVSLQIPSLNLAPVHQISPKPAFALAKPLPESNWWQGSSFRPPETYLKNLALLI